MFAWLALALWAGSVAHAGPAPSPLPSPSPSGPQEFHDDIERDFSLRTIGQLQVSNLRGDVVVQGWALDKIRVRARRFARASTLEEAKKRFGAMDFRYREFDGNIELSADYGKGLDIVARLRERADPQTRMQMLVSAPGNLKLRVWAENGKITVKTWDAPVEARTSAGAIEVDGVRSSSVALLCPDCPMSVRNVKSSLRCMGGAGPIDVTGVHGEHTYVETSSGTLNLNNIEGDQLYVTKSGSIEGKGLRGRVEFRTQQGAVRLIDGAGFLSGRTDSGDITATMDSWKFVDKAFLDSMHGGIDLTLPPNFSGDVDVMSSQGKVNVGFPVARGDSGQTFGPEPASHVSGAVGDGGEMLKIFTESGNVNLRKGN